MTPEEATTAAMAKLAELPTHVLMGIWSDSTRLIRHANETGHIAGVDLLAGTRGWIMDALIDRIGEDAFTAFCEADYRDANRAD